MLVDGDDIEEPVSDIVRGLIDGHIVLSRELAHQSHYPAIDIPGSLSRLAVKISNKEIIDTASYIRSKISLYNQSKDIINAGVYTSGTNKELDQFLSGKKQLDAFLCQKIDEYSDSENTTKNLQTLSQRV